MTVFYSLVLAFMTLIPQSQQQDQKARQGTYAITNARIETVSDGTIENGTIVIEGDRIIAVGINVAIPEGAQLIDGSGMHVYPGMIDSGTSLGLVEVGSVAETNDTNEVGEVTPHMDALTAVNPNAVAIPVTRVSGVTTVITEPGGGLLPGTAAAINLFGYTAEQMHAGDVRMLVLQFPRKGRFGNFRRFRGGGAARDPEAEYKKALILNPDHTGAHEYLGELYVETGRLDLAVQLLGRLKQICGVDCEEYEELEIAINDAKGS